LRCKDVIQNLFELRSNTDTEYYPTINVRIGCTTIYDRTIPICLRKV
jgi:hypothetical protein